MPNIASALKSEITRIARKEVRAEMESLKKSITTYRSEIAALKRRAQAFEQELRQLGKSMKRPEPALAPRASDDAKSSPSFNAKGLASQRQRLGLSADSVGLLLGTSGQSVYNWESGKMRPQARHMAAIAALRGLSKTQAAEILASRRSAK